MPASNKNNLSNKQNQFVQEYLIDLNATQAAIRAGYSEKTANVQSSQLLAKLNIQEAVRVAQAKRSKRTEISQDYVLTTIRDTVERCRQAEPVTSRNGERVVVETENGEEAVAYVFQSQSVLKGCELLGKHLKMFVDRKELTGPGGGPIENKWTVEIIKPDADNSTT